MSLIGKEISDFTVQAYAGGEFREQCHLVNFL